MRFKKNSQASAVALKRRKNFKENWFFYLLPLPGIIFLIMFCYFPMAGLYIVFERFTFDGGLFGSEFVGLKNFEFFFKNMDNALRATKNTLIINFGGIVFGTIVNVLVAIMVNEIKNKRFRGIAQSVMLFPYFMSWVALGAISRAFLDKPGGLINQILATLDMKTIDFYMNSKYWHGILIFVGAWKNVGYGSLIYYAAIVSFDSSLYEAAKLDGAGRTKQMWYITLPLLKPTIIIMVLLGIGGVLMGSVDSVMGMTQLNPLLLKSTDTIATFVYRSAIASGRFEAASAVTLYQSVFGFVMVMIANYTVKKVDPEYALF